MCKTIAHHNIKRCRHPWRPSNPGRSHARHSNTRISKAQHTNAPEDHKPCAAQNVLCQYKMHANATPTLLGIVSRVWTGTSRLLVCYPASWSHNVPPPWVVRVALPAGAIVAALARGPEQRPQGQLESFARAIPGTRLLHGRKVSAAYARSLTSYGSSGRDTVCSARKGGAPQLWTLVPTTRSFSR